MFKHKSTEFIHPDEKIAIIKYACEGNEQIHTHDFIELEYIYEGCGSQQINDSSYTVERGDLLFFNFQDSHSIEPSLKLGIINVIFNPEFFGMELVNSDNALDILALTAFKDFDLSVEKTLPKVRFTGKELIEVEAVLDYMKNEFDLKQPGYMTSLESYAKVLLVKIFRATRLTDQHNVYDDIRKIAPGILKFIEDNYNRKLSLTELAKQSFYNPSYFSKVFKECYGKSVIKYINDKRIESAIFLVKNTSDTIESICYQVGFNDKKQFFKLFKASTGMTPESYRILTTKNPTNV